MKISSILLGLFATVYGAEVRKFRGHIETKSVKKCSFFQKFQVKGFFTHGLGTSNRKIEGNCGG